MYYSIRTSINYVSLILLNKGADMFVVVYNMSDYCMEAMDNLFEEAVDNSDKSVV